jgi:hypothetical protein
MANIIGGNAVDRTGISSRPDVDAHVLSDSAGLKLTSTRDRFAVDKCVVGTTVYA